MPNGKSLKKSYTFVLYSYRFLDLDSPVELKFLGVCCDCWHPFTIFLIIEYLEQLNIYSFQLENKNGQWYDLDCMQDQEISFNNIISIIYLSLFLQAGLSLSPNNNLSKY